MLGAPMPQSLFLRPTLIALFVVASAGCTGDVGTTCFQDDECNSGLICCHVGSPFTQGTCQTEEVCRELGGGEGGTGGTGGTAGAGGIPGTGGDGGAAGAGGVGGQGGTAGGGGAAGQGGTAGAGGAAGAGG